MGLKIEDYALIGDLHTAALVGNNGSIDWLCLPRFDSEACFAALLGSERNGHWRIAPADGVEKVERHYIDGTLILVTEFENEWGRVRVTDFMPVRQQTPDVIRIVEGLHGRVPMEMELVMRFDYGEVVPWVRRTEHGLVAIGGPNALILRTPIHVRGENLKTLARFEVAAGEKIPFTLSWFPSHHATPPKPLDAERELARGQAWWIEWSNVCSFDGEARDAVMTSLLVLRSLIYEPTGGIVAAPTTSLPEKLGGVRNWDYRFCWVRDATLSLYALLTSGYTKEAARWRDWLLRAVSGEPAKLQIMYGVSGERRLTELELDWLDGYEGSKPVRIGNEASNQFQLDVYGEMADMLYTGRKLGMETSPFGEQLAVQVMNFLESEWQQPDDGIWEVRGGRQDFVHSKVMAWTAFDRTIKIAKMVDLAPADMVQRWQQTREEIHAEVLREGYDADRSTFTQYYGSNTIDASCLLIPQVGFLPATDERVVGTVEAVERELLVDGFVQRYSTGDADNPDGLPPGEGAFLPCSFWLADCYCLMGRGADARQMFDRLLAIRNDVGLLAEEYDTDNKRLVGNFPQAFSHVGLINTAYNVTDHGPAHRRAEECEDQDSG